MTVRQAAVYYQRVAKIANTTEAAAWKALPANPSLAQYKAYYALLAKTDRTFVDSLRARLWPKVCAADVALLIRKDSSSQVYELSMSKAKTLGDLIHLNGLWEKVDLDRAGQANAVRSDLGLPPVPIS